MENYLTEEQYQAGCSLWYWNTYKDKMLFTVDNNVSKRVLNPMQRVIEGNRKKASGVRAGVSDMVYVGIGFIAFIELKMSNGTQSNEQKEFQKQVEARSHNYYICKCIGQGDQLLNFKNLIICLKQMDSRRSSIGK